jgi:ribosome maturation factor RimP
MKEPNVANRAREVILPPIEGAGYELVDVQWKHEAGGWVLRVFVDKESGIGHADCERVSRELSAVLDVHDIIPHAYTLEVSSPGLERPLVTAAHFRRFLGKKARVRLHQGIEGRRNYAGAIVAVDGEAGQVTLEVDGREHVLPLADLDRANLEIDPAELSTKGRKGQGK